MVWLIILIAVISLFIIGKLIHFRQLKHKVFALIIVLFLLFLFLTFTSVANNNSIDLRSASGIFKAGRIYLSWLGQSFSNIKVLTGNAVKMDWMPKNASISS